MKSSELKRILKPLIKEAVKEIILEEGILSKIVSEVAQGMGGTMMVETKTTKKAQIDIREREHLLEMQRVSADDSGVDISGIMNIASGKWKTLAGN